MNWKRIIGGNLDASYLALEGLVDQVAEEMLAWKPAEENNWMTTGQLLAHLATAGGGGFNGFINGDWGMPADFDFSTMKPEEMLPPAEALPAVASLAEAKEKIMADKERAYRLLGEIDDERLASEMMSAPWDPRQMPLGAWLLATVHHLDAHKSQLFFYLKLLGKPVNTHDLYGKM